MRKQHNEFQHPPKVSTVTFSCTVYVAFFGLDRAAIFVLSFVSIDSEEKNTGSKSSSCGALRLCGELKTEMG
jgi:hypothetical protein